MKRRIGEPAARMIMQGDTVDVGDEVPMEVTDTYHRRLHDMLITGRASTYFRMEDDHLVVSKVRAIPSYAVACMVALLGLDGSVRDAANSAIDEDFVLCGPLTIAAYRATWMEELDRSGSRVRRVTE